MSTATPTDLPGRLTALVAVAVLVLMVPAIAAAQQTPNTQIDSNTTADDLADALIDSSGPITVTNAEFTGHADAAGTFTDGPFGMDDGIAISNGDVHDMPFDEDEWTLSSTDLGEPGHPLCDQLTDPEDSHDAAILEVTFDVDGTVDGIQFEYTVGSDEYPDFIGQGYNDGFGVFLDPEGLPQENVALDTNDEPITIDGPFFSSGTVVEWPDNEMNFEGSTPLLSTQAPVWPDSEGNVVEIVICDAFDAVFDTAAFMSSMEPCFGDCDGTSVCGNGVVEPGEQCDLNDFHPDYADCPDGYEGAPMCNNDPANTNGDGSCTVDPIPDGCTSIDYCADDDLNSCHENAECTDFPGANYECDCLDGYAGDGFDCTLEVNIDEPEEGSVTNDPTPTFSGTGEPGEEVTVYVDGEEVGTAEVDEDGEWEVEPDDDLDEGEVTAEATDSNSSDDVTFEIDLTAPMVVWTYPQDGDVFSESPTTLEGEAEPGAEVEVYVDGEYIGTTTADEDGNWAVDLDDDLDDGEYEAVAEATDEAGNTAEDIIDFVVDTTAELIILQPEEGDTVRTSTPTVTGEAEPGAEVEIYVDGEKVGTTTADEDGNWSWTPDDEMDDGEVTVTARTDSPSGQREDDVTFEIDTSTTAVAIESPEDGEVTNDNQPHICGNAAPGATVDIWLDGEHIGTTTADSNGQWCYQPTEPLDDGEITAEAEADDDGVITEDDSSFTIDTEAPFLFVETPDDGETVPPVGVTAIGESEPDTAIDVYIDGEHIGDTTTAGDESWDVPLHELTRGEEYELRATSTDEAGNTTVVEHIFFVEDGYISGGGPACASPAQQSQAPWLIFAALALLVLFATRPDRAITETTPE